ncbi:MAG: hypothetical protein V3T22_07990 [Planctomycetota bacterium]
MIDVALASCDAYLDLHPDDRILREALHARGLTTTVVSWTDEAYDWTGVRCCLPRNTWDYPERAVDFDHWLGRAHELTQLWNPLRALRWNVHKRYLGDLERAGVATLPTATFSAGAQVDLAAELDRRGWREVVVKPAIGLSARLGMRLSRDEIPSGQAHLDRILAKEDALVQPFARSVESRGELSLIYLDGGFSHAVVKRAAPGEWRVQEELGGTVEAALPREDEIELACRAMAVAPGELLYARVDLVRDGSDQPLLMELELIEPVLFFGWGEGSAERLAGALFARLARGK